VKYLVSIMMLMILLLALPARVNCEIFTRSSFELRTAYHALAGGEKEVVSSFPLRVIEWYQHRISPFSSPRCLFYPTCSEFTKQAVSRYGFFFGILMSVDRLFYREGKSSLEYYPLYKPEQELWFDNGKWMNKNLPETAFDPVYHNFIFNPEDYLISQ